MVDKIAISEETSQVEKVLNIARLAGLKVLEIYDSDDFQIKTKVDKENSPLTRADLIANETIIEGINEISDYPIVTEESYVAYETRKNFEKFWLVDPLDGTKDFISKNGEFTINIALIEHDKPVLGVIYVPFFRLMYRAERGRGAYKNGKKIYNNSKRKDLTGCDSRFHSTEAMSEFFEIYNIKNVKKYGSALKFCKLAEGEIDVYPRLNGTKEWDTAAGHIIANEAGCKLVDVVTREELVYNKEKIENNFFIASRKDLDFL